MIEAEKTALQVIGLDSGQPREVLGSWNWIETEDKENKTRGKENGCNRIAVTHIPTGNALNSLIGRKDAWNNL